MRTLLRFSSMLRKGEVMLRRIFGCLFLVSGLFAVTLGCSSEPPDPCKDVTCQANETCKLGTCIQTCTAEQTQCGTQCFNTQTDTKNCGQCGNLCRTGEVCEKGACKLTCEDGKEACNGQCVDFQTDAQHCGDCDKTCKAGEVCETGACKQVCPAGTTDCSGECKDTQNDPAHCGACGTACKTGEVCKAGSCTSLCPKDQTLCKGQCVSTQTSRLHCGACDNACTDGQQCNAGQCKTSCPSGQTLCKDKCVDVQSSQAHCGACDNACKSGEVCNQGKCAISCSTNLTNCEGSCVDVNLDRNHCGRCKNACRPVDVCTSGKCTCPKGKTDCSGNCVDLQTENLHCGTCGTTCPLGQTCLKGKCEAACSQGETNCAGSCVDLVKETRHCGICGNSCLSGNNCCNGKCSNPQIDSKNCGKCGTVCAGGRVCTGGTCLCPTGQSLCSNQCSDVNNDPKNCGSCGKACKPTETCQRSVCKPTWAISAGGIINGSSEESTDIAFDSQGNSYILMRFNAEMTVGTLTFKSTSKGLVVAKINGQRQVDWAVSPGLSDFDANGIGVDSKGNVYIGGTFSTPTATFGSTTLSNPAIVSSHNSQIFVAKLDNQGKWLWAKQGGGNNQDFATDLAVDSSGNVYVAGYFSTGFTTPTATFGTFKLSSQSNSDDLLVAKLDTNGAWQWVTSAGNSASEAAHSIAVDSKGNVFVTGTFDKTITLGTTTLSNPNESMFISQLDNKGAWKWAMYVGGKTTNQQSVAVDSSGNVYVVGNFTGSVTLGTTTLSSKGSIDPFVAKLNASGAWQWAQNGGGKLGDRAAGVGVDSKGNVYVAGTVASSTATFGSASFATLGGAELFLAQLNPSGAWQWARSYGGSRNETARGLAVDGTGNSYVVGEFTSTNALFLNTTLSSTGGSDVFVAKFSSTGAPTAATSFGGKASGRDQSHAIARDSSGNLYITGTFQGTMTLGSNNLTSQGGSDVFVAKVSKDGNWDWATSGGSTLFDKSNGVAVDSKGNVYVVGTFEALGTKKTATFGTLTLTSKGSSDVFVAQLNSTGGWTWVRSAGGISSDEGSGIATDAAGNVYISGWFFGSASTFGTTTLSSRGSRDGFVAKLDNKGNWQWATSIGSRSIDYAQGLFVDKSNALYVTGAASTGAQFGSLSMSAIGSRDIFVAQLSTSGAVRWLRSAGSSGQDFGTSVATDSKGNVYVTGTIEPSFAGTATFGSLTAKGSGGNNLFVAQLTNTGTWKWLQAVGNGQESSQDIAVDSQDNIYITGKLGREATFGNFSLSATLDTCHIYIAKLNSAGTWQGVTAAPRQGSTCTSSGEGIVVDNTGSTFVTGFFKGTALFSNKPLSSKGGDDMFVWNTTP